MRILHINPNITVEGGGLGSLLSEMVALEKEIGFASSILTLNNKGTVRLELFPCDVIMLKMTFPFKFSFSVDAVTWMIRNIHNYDLIVFHSSWHFLLFSLSYICKKFDKPFIIWPHNSLDPFDLKKKVYLKKIIGKIVLKKILEFAKVIVCASETESEKIITFGARVKKVILPYVVSYKPRLGDRQYFRSKFNISDSDFVILSLSRIDYKKGIDEALGAIKKAKAKISRRFIFVIAGPDSNNYKEKIVKLISDYQLSDHVLLIDSISGKDKDSALVGSDLFILPSKNENFGIAPIEALNSGCPILISRNVYIWRELYKFGSTWLCESESTSIEKQLISILSDEEDYKSKKAKSFITGNQFSIRTLSDKYKMFYESIVELA